METRVITAHIPRPLAERIDLLAERNDRSRVWVIKQALEAWLEQDDERHRLTLEALADVSAGNIIPHQAVAEWANSLGSENPVALPK
jgi:predicted transcriptional regulator